MGIVKINDELHEEVRKASSVMVRSINAQAEFWMKVGMLAEARLGNPSFQLSFVSELESASIDAVSCEELSSEELESASADSAPPFCGSRNAL